jgi:hypothetical protein
MLVADYANGAWGLPEIVPYGPISFEPSMATLHYGQAIFRDKLNTIANNLRVISFNLFHAHLIHRLFTEQDLILIFSFTICN